VFSNDYFHHTARRERRQDKNSRHHLTLTLFG